MTPDTVGIIKLVELEVKNQLDQRLSTEIEKKSTASVEQYRAETEKVRTTIRRIGAAIVGVLGLGAFTNLTDLFGIPQKIEKGIESQIQAAITSSDVPGLYKTRIKTIFSESIIAHLELVNMNAAPKEPTRRGFPRDDEDAQTRLLKLPEATFLLDHILADEVGYDLFSRVVSSFKWGDELTKDLYRTRVLDVLAVAISGSDTEKRKFGRLYSKPRYAVSLVKGFDLVRQRGSDDEIPEKLRRLLARDDLPRSVRVSILEQAILRSDAESLTHFLKALDSQDKEVRGLGGAGLATVAPDRKELRSLIDAIDKEVESTDNARLLLKLAKALCHHVDTEDKLLPVSAAHFAEIVRIFSAKMDNWYWRTTEQGYHTPEARSNTINFDIEKSNPTLWVRTSPTSRLGQTMAPVFHRECRKAALALVDELVTKNDATSFMRIAKLLSIAQGEIPFGGDATRRGGAFAILPALALTEAIELKCNDRTTSKMDKDAIVPIYSFGRSTPEKLYAYIGADRKKGDGKWCDLTTLPPLKAKAILVVPDTSEGKAFARLDE